MTSRLTIALLLAPAAAFAAGSRPVCPGPVDGARCHSHVVIDELGNPAASSTPPSSAMTPAQFHTAYSLPPAASTPTTIAIVDAYDDPNIESDLAVYSSQFGLPPCTTANGCFTKVNQDGLASPLPRTNAGWALEISLDVETAHAICPNCNILLVEANTSSFANLLAAEQVAIAHSSIVSNSWGGSEFSSETSATYDGVFAIGEVVTVSSGDSGFGVQYPAASQYVVAVGGTTLNIDSNSNRVSETVWSGAGSGCSAYEPKPSFQTDSGCANRTVADVSADADPNTGAAVYDTTRYHGQSGWFQVGGTSLSAPLIASVYALAGNAYVGAYPYSHANMLFDVTSGSNGNCGSYLCTGTVGYDGPSGLGTPNGVGGF
jgi:subtilase family serine protease